MWVPPARDPLSFSAWFEHGVAAVKVAMRRVGLLLVAVWLLVGAAGWVLVMSAFGSDDGRELRRLLEIDQTTFGPTGSSMTAELTNAEAERAWELIQDTFWSAVPWIIVLVGAIAVAWAWSVALVARAVEPHLAEPSSGDRPVEHLGDLVGIAFRRVPAVIGSGIVVFLAFVVVWMVASLPVVFVAVGGGGGAAIVLTVLFVAFLVMVATAWLWVRLTLASVVAAVGGHGIGVTRSWRLTRERFWYVTGRLLITGLIAGVASGAVNSVTGFGQFLGFAVYFALVFAFQSIAIAASVMITVAGHLVTIDQIERHP